MSNFNDFNSLTDGTFSGIEKLQSAFKAAINVSNLNPSYTADFETLAPPFSYPNRIATEPLLRRTDYFTESEINNGDDFDKTNTTFYYLSQYIIIDPSNHRVTNKDVNYVLGSSYGLSLIHI